MRATLDADKFAAYFKRDGGLGAPALHIPGFTHPVRDVYLEECLRTTGQLIGRGSQFALGREAFLERKKMLESQQGVHGGQGRAHDLPQYLTLGTKVSSTQQRMKAAAEEEGGSPPEEEAAAAKEGEVIAAEPRGRRP
jgi:HrpA-like RNA helicase